MSNQALLDLSSGKPPAAKKSPHKAAEAMASHSSGGDGAKKQPLTKAERRALQV